MNRADPERDGVTGAKAPGVEDLATWLRGEASRRVADRPGSRDGVPSAEDGWRLITECVEAYAHQALREGRRLPSEAIEQQATQQVFNDLFALSGLQPLIEDDSIENINCNGCDQVWIRRADGTREQAPPVAASDTALVELVRVIAARSGTEERRLDRGSPAVSVELADGSRLFATMAVSRRPSVSIRRHRHRQVTLADVQRLGTIDRGLRGFLAALVAARKNVVIAGGTAAGKTTLLRALATQIPPFERLVTIEDAFELGLDRDTDAHPDAVALQAREPNIEGEGEVTLTELVRWALRMSPDRVIVGEVRGSEIMPMLSAMNQGNDGSMTTVHASSTRGAFTKMAAYAAQSTERLPIEVTNLLIAQGVNFIVHLTADRHSGRRVVSSVREIISAEGTQITSNEVFRPRRDGRAVPGAPLRAATLEELAAVEFDPDLLARPEGWWER